ncbi:hypothetical protein EBR78_08735 [bacterium]|nr:hypothetical protein [bacterium]NBX82418.1 hypothetical protein [bacterium]
MKPSFSEVITAETFESFRKGTQTESLGVPLTFATRFRQSEFSLLDDLKIDLRQLLHSEQTYFYHEPIRVGDLVEIDTQVTDNKTKAGMQFVTLETSLRVHGVKKITSQSKMVIRQTGEMKK